MWCTPVHWLVDDTAWDVHDLAESIGAILRNDAEADAVRAVVAAVVAVSDRQGVTAPDASWFAANKCSLHPPLGHESAFCVRT